MAAKKKVNRMNGQSGANCSAVDTGPLPGSAEWNLRLGVISVARAFDLFGDQSGKALFTPEVRKTAHQLCGELVRLFHESDNEAVDLGRMKAVKSAELDGQFQRFLGELSIGRRPASPS